MPGVHAIAALFSVLTAAATADPRAPSAQVRREPRFDVSVAIGVMTLAKKTGSYPRGFEPSTGLAQVTAGYYWTAHWKTEFGATWTAKRRDTFEEELWDSPIKFDDVLLIHSYRILKIAAAQIYEFGSGRLRPFIGGGAGVDIDSNHDLREDFTQQPLTDAQRQSYAQAGIALTTVDLFPCVTLSNPRGTSQCGLPNADQRTTRGFAFATAGVKLHIGKRGFTSFQINFGKKPVTRFAVGFGVNF